MKLLPFRLRRLQSAGTLGNGRAEAKETQMSDPSDVARGQD